MNRWLLLPTLALLLSCGRSHPAMDQLTTIDSLAPTPAEHKLERPGEEAETPAPSTPQPIVRKIIRQGDISFQTDDAPQTRSEVRRIVAALGGYISGDNSYATDDRTEYRLDIRIPAHRFDSLLLRISEKAGHIESRNISAQDVTAEYIDVQARIHTQKQLEARYLELLKKATTVEEILSIERELGTLRAEIESVEGRMKYLSDQVAMSSLTVSFHEKASSGPGFGHAFGQALRAGWKNILSLTLTIVRLWPLLVVAPLAVWGFRRWRTKA